MSGPLGHVACCVEGTPLGAAALRTALTMGDACRRLSLLTRAGDRRPEFFVPSWAVADTPEAVLAAGAGPGTRVRPDFQTEVHAEQVCDWAEREEADLIVMGAPSADEPQRPFVAYLLSWAPCQVLVIHRP